MEWNQFAHNLSLFCSHTIGGVSNKCFTSFYDLINILSIFASHQLMAELDVARKTEFQLRLANKNITASLNSKSEELEKTRVMVSEL